MAQSLKPAFSSFITYFDGNKCSYYFSELTEFKQRRIAYFKKNLVDLVELELKHSKVYTFSYLKKLFLCVQSHSYVIIIIILKDADKRKFLFIVCKQHML